MRRTIEWIDGHVDVVDQTALPQQRRVALHTVSEVVDAIHRLVVRGAQERNKTKNKRKEKVNEERGQIKEY